MADEMLCNAVELIEALHHWHDDVRVVALTMWVYLGGARLMAFHEPRIEQ